MNWAYGWPLDEEYALQLSNDLNHDEADNADHVLAAVDYIAGKADWEHNPTCWVGRELRIVFGAYVDERQHAHPPQRVIMSGATPLANWYRLAKWMTARELPGEGELWESTCLGEDDDLVEYVSYLSDEDEYDSDEHGSEEADNASDHSSMTSEDDEGSLSA